MIVLLRDKTVLTLYIAQLARIEAFTKALILAPEEKAVIVKSIHSFCRSQVFPSQRTSPYLPAYQNSHHHRSSAHDMPHVQPSYVLSLSLVVAARFSD